MCSVPDSFDFQQVMPQAISQTHSYDLSFFTYRLETTVILVLGPVDFSFELNRN